MLILCILWMSLFLSFFCARLAIFARCRRLVMLDSEKTAVCVSIYHMTYEMYDHISPKDVFHIIEPIKKTITVQLSSGKTVQYDCLQVDHPKALLRNGGRLTGKAQPSYMSVRCFDR